MNGRVFFNYIKYIAYIASSIMSVIPNFILFFVWDVASIFENKIDKNKQTESSDLSNQVVFARVDEIIKLNLADEYFNAFFQNKDSCILIFIGEGSKILNKNSIYLEEKFDFFSEISFFEENTTIICDSGYNFNQLGKPQEVNFLPKKPKNKGFFEKFFNFFN